jgi:hypothetical protein
MSYRHYLTISASTVEVFPLNFLSTLLIDERDKTRAFYRKKFSGTLMFTNNNGADDFDLLYAIEVDFPCTKIPYLIEKNGAYYWDGYFSTTDGRFDLDNCTFEVTPKENDAYVDLLAEADTQWNILDTPTEVTTTAFIPTALDISYTHNRWLAKIGSDNVLEFLADKIKAGVTVSSNFFTDATNPATVNDNLTLHLTIAQKSDIIRPTATDSANSAMMSWNELMEILWGMFQVQWNYDSGTDTINVEHVSWFPPVAGMDLRTQTISKGSNKYTYLKEEMPFQERFYPMEGDWGDFVQAVIMYDAECVNTDPDTNIKETRLNVTTDLEYIINFPDAISDEGFVILCNYLDGADYKVKYSIGALTGTLSLNAHLSCANLLDNYFRHNRVLIDGRMNSAQTTFWTAQKTKRQEIFAIVCPSDNYDSYDYVTTELGETWFSGAKGTVEKAELNPNGEMKFTLLYGPADNENTGVLEDEGMIIEQGVDCVSLTATLFKAMDQDRDILVREVITGTIPCTGNWETWTIPLGATTDTFTLDTVCKGLSEGDKIVLELDTTDLGTWVYRYYPNANCESYA